MNDNQPKSKLVILIAFLGVLLLILMGIFSHYAPLVLPAQEAPTLEAAYPVPGTPSFVPVPPTETFSSIEARILNEYQKMLEGNNLDEEMRNSLETKVAMYSRIVTQIAISQQTPSPALSTFPTLLPMTDAPLPTGLWEGGTSDFHHWEAIIQNVWQQYIDNKKEHITVYAGELGSETDYPGRGVVFVLRRTSDKRVRSFNTFLLPEGTGWVRISEIKGDYLVLTSKEGQTFYFYTPGQRFVSSLTETAPTVTLLPTPSPLPTVGTPPTPYP